MHHDCFAGPDRTAGTQTIINDPPKVVAGLRDYPNLLADDSLLWRRAVADASSAPQQEIVVEGPAPASSIYGVCSANGIPFQGKYRDDMLNCEFGTLQDQLRRGEEV